MPLMLILASITSRVVPAISVTIALSLCMLQEIMLNKLNNHEVKYAKMITNYGLPFTQTHRHLLATPLNKLWSSEAN